MEKLEKFAFILEKYPVFSVILGFSLFVFLIFLILISTGIEPVLRAQQTYNCSSADPENISIFMEDCTLKLCGDDKCYRSDYDLCLSAAKETNCTPE